MKLKRLKYFLLYGIAIIFLIFSWLFFIKFDFISNKDQKITFLIATLGLIFSFMQFIYNNWKHKDNVIYQIRYQEYNKLINLFNEFSNSLNECMLKDYNPNEIATKLMNIQNEISVLINTTSEWIFPKLNFTEESKKLYELTKNILDLTSKFGKEFENIIRDNSEFNQQTLLIELERIKWHNSVKNLLGKIHRMKYKLFSLIQNYLKE